MSFMLGVIYAECHKQAHYVECLYAECRYAECRYAECHGVSSLPLQVTICLKLA